jgi:hypothetical protein
MKMIDDEVRNHLQMAFVKYAEHLDRQCEFEVGNITRFRRWAFSALPELADTIKSQKSRASNREFIRRKMGVPVGIDRLIFGAGEQ